MQRSVPRSSRTIFRILAEHQLKVLAQRIDRQLSVSPLIEPLGQDWNHCTTLRVTL